MRTLQQSSSHKIILLPISLMITILPGLGVVVFFFLIGLIVVGSSGSSSSSDSSSRFWMLCPDFSKWPIIPLTSANANRKLISWFCTMGTSSIQKLRDFTVYFINIRFDGRWREGENQSDQSQDAPYLMDTQTDLLIIRNKW